MRSHRLQAPRQHGAIFAEPPLAEVGPLLAANRLRLRHTDLAILGQSLKELRREARRSALAAAQEYLRRAGEPIPAINPDSLLLAGHQPELFHPGVWVKNFALNGLASKQEATPLNLVVDNDTVKAAELRVPFVVVPLPSSDQFRPAIVPCPFDSGTEEVPYEERIVRDEALFASLVERVTTACPPPGFDPLLKDFWPEVCKQRERTPLLGERIAAARRTWERRWGCHNLELPVSLLCQSEAFAWFAGHLLNDLPRLHTIYNDCVREHRRQHRIRSRSHPVPDLASEGDWLEAPFWAWRAGPSRRGRLMVRLTPSAIELRVGKEAWPSLPREPRQLVGQWLELERNGLKVRSRALTTTMYARLLLGDLFVHGIGGARYDELTDEMIRRFFGIEPPGYLVLSATLLLPLPTYPVDIATRRRLAHDVRDYFYNPQRHLQDHEPAIEEKREWMVKQPTSRRERRERFQKLRALTEQLRMSLNVRIQAMEEALAKCDRELQANAVLQRRDYAFCLYPDSVLRPVMGQFLGNA